MNYIMLRQSYGRQSMKMVLDKMNEQCSLLIKIRTDSWRTVEKENDELTPIRVTTVLGNSPIINWGNHIFNNDDYFTINKPSGISKASNKTLARELLQNAGVPVPHTWFDYRDVQYPCIARPDRHHGGKNWYILNNRYEMASLVSSHDTTNWYYSEIFDKTNEYRVHCAHGRVLMISDKPLVEGEIRGNHAVTEESWRALRWSEFNPDMCRIALDAVEVLGLDYAAVDMMYDSRTNTSVICEVNTSPSINTEYSSGKYARYFDWLIRNNYPDHLDYSRLTRGSDFVWTDSLFES